jgi:hypothetical protein
VICTTQWNASQLNELTGERPKTQCFGCTIGFEILEDAMNRTLRRLFMSTSVGLGIVAPPFLLGGSVQAQDSSTCMQDVQMLREQASLSKGGDSAIAASGNAAEEACAAGNHAQASAYLADARQRLNLREAQRDESGAAGGLGSAAEVSSGNATTAAAGARVGSTGSANDVDDTAADDVESAANDVADEVDDAADDAGDAISDAADDIGDAFDDAF